MAGKYRAAGPASSIQTGKPSGRRSAGVRTFAGTPLTVDGITREAMGSTSLLGASIPKGIGAAALAASHGAAANSLTNSQADAQINVASVLAQIDAVAKSRALRAVARNAEGVANSSTDLAIESPRLLAHGRGPRVAVQGMTSGDLARVVAMFRRYGYTVGRAFTPQRLDVMTRMSYWKTLDATIVGAVPQERRQTIAGAFNRGTTVWTSIADIGTDVTGSNEPLSGISY